MCSLDIKAQRVKWSQKVEKKSVPIQLFFSNPQKSPLQWLQNQRNTPTKGPPPKDLSKMKPPPHF